MLFSLLFSISQAYKQICVCNKECPIQCQQDKFIVQSSSFSDILLSQIKNEKEIELDFYSKENDFTFPISLSSFGDSKVTIKTINISQPIKLKIKEKFKLFSKTIEVKPNYKIILPNLTTFQDKNYHTKKKILEGPSYSTVPLSIPLLQMNVEGTIDGCNYDKNSNNNCVGNHLNLNTQIAYTCGHRCHSTSANFEYKFKGVKFLLYGTFDESFHQFDVEIDGVIVKTVDEYRATRDSFSLVYESDVLEYKEHTVRTVHKGQSYELFKLAYWPQLNLRRVNSTDIKLISGTWKSETDNIGGRRERADNGGVASVTLYASKFWIYGVKDTHLHEFNLTFDDKTVVIDQHSHTRQEGVLLYESTDVLHFNTTFTFSSSGPMILYCIYYADPHIPISIGPRSMGFEGDIKCLKSGISGIYNLGSIEGSQDVGCNVNSNPNTSYNCGLLCNTQTGKYNYTFKGVKFAIYGSFKPDLRKFIVEYNGKTVEVNEESQSQNERVPVFVSENLEYNEYTVKIYSNGNQNYEFSKFVFWPSLKTRRFNSTLFIKEGGYTKESDGIGGFREYNSTDRGVSTKRAYIQIKCTRFWLYSFRDDSTGDITLYYNGLTDIAHTKYLNGRLDTTLIYESRVSDYNNMILTLATQDVLMLYCIYCEFEEETTTATVPISVGLKQTKHGGTINCENYHKNITNSIDSDKSLQEIGCEINNMNSPAAYNCGWRCYGTDANYEYTFKGVKFGIYGTLRQGNGKFDVELDGVDIAEVNTDSILNFYSLLYESNVHEYKEHTVKIKSKGVNFALYKLVYWPTMAAKRKNSTDFVKEGTYTKESDGIGGFREYNNTNAEKHALIQLKCTRFWLYSFKDGTTSGDIEIQYNGIKETLHTELPDKRVESELIYESPVFEYTSITLTLKTMKVLMLHYIYYEEPDEVMMPIPMSVGAISMYHDGSAKCSYKNGNNEIVLSSDIDFRNIGCDHTYLSSPNAYQCGLKCWSTNAANYEYTFKGVKFALYGTYDPGHGDLIIDYDGKETEISQLSARQQYAVLYESTVDVYKEHTVKIRPKVNDKAYELYKLVYWPSMKAKRINASSFKKTSGDFYLESDGIGGSNFRSQGAGGRPNSTFEITFPCSKLWLYGTKLYWEEYVEIIYNDVRKHIDLNSTDQKINVLVDESDDFSYRKLTLKGEAYFDAFLACIYYHDEPTKFEYINKTFVNTLPYIDIYVPSNSRVNQISKCHFIDISENFDYFIKLDKEIMIFDDVFQYSNEQQNPPAPFKVCYNGQLTIRNCSFENSKGRNNQGNVLFCGNGYAAEISFESCQFINCGQSGAQSIINTRDINSFIKLDNCSVVQNDCDSSPKVIDSRSSRATLNDCKFTNSGMILIDIPSNSKSSFVLLENPSEIIITNCTFDSTNFPHSSNGEKIYPTCIDLEIKVPTSITFEDNIFANLTKSSSEYKSVYHHFVEIDARQMLEELVIRNVSFENNKCYSLYGGGSGLNILGIPRVSFYECKFINNEARQSTVSRSSGFDDEKFREYYNGDGGGLQIGFRCSMIEVDLKIENCSFVRNRAKRHGGALAIQTFGKVEIIGCNFESNEANADFSSESSSELLYENHFNKKNEGRAGAIYINPSYSYTIGGNSCYDTTKYMTEVSIKDSTFLSNSAFDGFAIYIEGDDPGTSFELSNNNFASNYNFGPSLESDPNKTVRGVIATEIHSIQTTDVLSQNSFSDVRSKKVVYVDHFGSRIATIAFTESTQFTFSSAFTETNDFTKSNAFSKSSDFIPSDKFTKSNYFSFTDGFTKSSYFSSTIGFTKTDYFSQSNYFTESGTFTESDDFLRTKRFTKSNTFTKSSIFTKSEMFTKSDAFSKSLMFTKSDAFSKSLMFTKSTAFTESSMFSKSTAFTESLMFTKSDDFLSIKISTESNELAKSSTYSGLGSVDEVTNGPSTNKLSEMTITNEPIIQTENHPDTVSKKNKSISIPLIAGLVVGIICLIAIIILIIIFVRRRKKDKEEVQKTDDTSLEVGQASNNISQEFDNPLYNNGINEDPFDQAFDEDI